MYVPVPYSCHNYAFSNLQVQMTYCTSVPVLLLQGGSAPSATDAHNSHVQQQLITLLQSLVAQHQQRKQQQQQMMLENQQQEALFHSRDLSSAITQKAEEILKMQTALPLTTTRAMSAAPNEPNMTTCVTTSAVNPASTALTDIPESDVQAAILDNLFATTGPPPGTSALNSTRLFQTSSDTVDQLLRGLSVRTESDSIQKLSQDTASVLPTFARALESSMGLPAQSDAPSTPITAACGSDASIRGDGMRGDGVRGNGWRDDGVHTGREVMKDCVRFGGDASPESGRRSADTVHSVCMWTIGLLPGPLSTLGTHVQEGYGTCLVCVCVCSNSSVNSVVSTFQVMYIRLWFRLYSIFNS